MKLLENSSLVLGRLLLGLYFILPGIQKITQYEQTVAYMTLYEVPFIGALLPLTIVLQLLLGLAIIVGFRAKISAFILAGLTLVISLYMHSFWNLPEGADAARETQNFVKNMAIMAGLLILAGRGAGAISLDSKREKQRANMIL
jgi:putative oxidoreductase